MLKYVICFLALAACGLPEKNHCNTADDCLGDQVCREGVCAAPTSGCGPTEAVCAADAMCTDVAGTMTCTCNAGFSGDGLSCADIDECAAAPCADHAVCSNLTASFACACDAAFTGDGTSYCVPTRFTKVAPAGGFTCGLAEDGGIYCWGQNFSGDLGDGTTVRRTRPTQVGTATDWIDVEARTIVGCGLRADHSIWCWGLGTNGELGDGNQMTSYIPTKVASDKPGVGWKAMALGRQTLCGLHDDGSLACWGLDRVTGASRAVPVAVDANTDWTAIAVGTVLCGIRGGHLYCWGASRNGELGLGAVESQATPAQVGTDTWKRVSVGTYNTCAIRSDDALLCWGNSQALSGVLQYGNTPQQIGTATDWQSISLSDHGILGLRAGGHAYAWGGNTLGELGVPLAPEVAEPTPLSGDVTNWSQVRSGNVHGCGVADGQAYCWGDASGGLLGDGTITTLAAPTKIGTEQWSALAGGPGNCGLRADGALACWGFDIFHGIGFGNFDPVWSPTRLGSDTWSAVAGSSNFAGPSACAIRGGKPYCWGDNFSGQLGLGSTTTPQLAPAAILVPAETRWTEIAINDHTCAITDDAKLWCWGADFGGLGAGTNTGTPVSAPASPLAGAWLHVAVAGGLNLLSMTCGIQTDHTLWCWGTDPNLATPPRLTPTRVGSAASWQALSMSSGNNGRAVTACAIQLDGTLWCWGERLGNGTTDTASAPVQVGPSNDWKTVNVGSEVCAIKTTGTLWCWGNQGLLGDGVPVNDDELIPAATRPTQIGSDADWSTVMTDSRPTTSCATKRDGSLWCWGLGAKPIPGISATPVPIR